MSVVDKLVDGLDKIFMQLLALLLLLGPVVGVGLDVNAMDLLVILDKGVNGVCGQLESDLVAQNHVDVDNVSLEVDKLMAEESLVVVRGHLCFGQLGEHERGQGPDSIGR